MKMDVVDREIRSDTLKNIDKKIEGLNNKKIKAFFESLGLEQRDDIAKDYLN